MIAPLDVRTMVVMLLLSAVLMSVTLAVGNRTSRGNGFMHWNLGLALIALGWLLIALRGTLPDLAGVALADALLLAGLCLQLAALIRFAGRPIPGALLYLPGPALFMLVLPVLHDYALLTLVVSALYAPVLGVTAWFAARLKGDAGAARWMLAAACAAAGAVLLIRAGVLLRAPPGREELYSGSAIHVVAFLALFVLLIAGSVAFLLMLRERAEIEIRRLAMFDALTALLNRRAFMDMAERELARARRGGAPVSILMMDLDHFKRVNDEHGHQAGDRVLAEFAALAQRSVRAGDLVGRYGGEEFCALLPGASLDTALAIAERLRAATAARPLGGLPNSTTASIGVASCDPAAAPCDLDGVIALADAALYRAKRDGRNRVAVDAAAGRTLRLVGRNPATAG